MRLFHLFFIASTFSLLAACNTTGIRDPNAPENRLVDLQIQLGMGYMQEGQYDTAMKRLQKALELDGSSPEAHNAMALLFERIDRPAEAEEHFRRAVTLDPGFAAAHNNFGSFLCAKGRPEEGEKELVMAAENPLYQRREGAYTNAGLCMMRHGDMEKAETYLREALRVNAKVPLALIAMAQLGHDQARYLQSRAYLQRYAEVAPRTPQSLWLGYRVETALGDHNAASNLGLALRAQFPDSREAQLLEQAQGR